MGNGVSITYKFVNASKNNGAPKSDPDENRRKTDDDDAAAVTTAVTIIGPTDGFNASARTADYYFNFDANLALGETYEIHPKGAVKGGTPVGTVTLKEAVPQRA